MRHQPADLAMIYTVVTVGNTSGAEVDRFKEFALTPDEVQEVEASLIRECHANFECRLYDDALVDKYNFFIFKVVKVYVVSLPMHPQTIHYMGDGVFMVSDNSIAAAYCCCRCNIDAAENKEINNRHSVNKLKKRSLSK